MELIYILLQRHAQIKMVNWLNFDFKLTSYTCISRAVHLVKQFVSGHTPPRKAGVIFLPTYASIQMLDSCGNYAGIYFYIGFIVIMA